MARYAADTIPVCEEHAALANGTKNCKKCGVEYCEHYASKTDVRFCGNCLSDFRIVQKIVEKEIIAEAYDGTYSFSRKYQAVSTKLQGTDWLFNQVIIPQLTDQELEETIEYHRANVGIMLQERESRKLERQQKLIGVKIAPVTRKSKYQEEKDAAKSSKPRKKKDKSGNSAASIADMLAQMAKAGMTVEQLQAILGAK